MESTRSVEERKKEGLDALYEVVKNTEKNNEITSRVQEVIKEANIRTERIKAASTQIDAISYQTNLLALNASIEAARACFKHTKSQCRHRRGRKYFKTAGCVSCGGRRVIRAIDRKY